MDIPTHQQLQDEVERLLYEKYGESLRSSTGVEEERDLPSDWQFEQSTEETLVSPIPGLEEERSHLLDWQADLWASQVIAAFFRLDSFDSNYPDTDEHYQCWSDVYESIRHDRPANFAWMHRTFEQQHEVERDHSLDIQANGDEGLASTILDHRDALIDAWNNALIDFAGQLDASAGEPAEPSYVAAVLDWFEGVVVGQMLGSNMLKEIIGVLISAENQAEAAEAHGKISASLSTLLGFNDAVSAQIKTISSKSVSDFFHDQRKLIDNTIAAAAQNRKAFRDDVTQVVVLAQRYPDDQGVQDAYLHHHYSLRSAEEHLRAQIARARTEIRTQLAGTLLGQSETESGLVWKEASDAYVDVEVDWKGPQHPIEGIREAIVHAENGAQIVKVLLENNTNGVDIFALPVKRVWRWGGAIVCTQGPGGEAMGASTHDFGYALFGDNNPPGWSVTKNLRAE